MEVLVIQCNDYDVTIKTRDIVAPWKRFSNRVSEADTYCEYSTTHEESELKLRHVFPDNSTTFLSHGIGQEWQGLPPIMFETEVYHFFIEFHSSLLGTPTINHPKREIVECFDYYKGMLTGSINFINNPGTFVLSFSYVRHDGSHVTDSITLEVVSPKLDTKQDLTNIKQLINAEYENYVYEYLTLTFQSHSIDRNDKDENQIIWLSIFQQIVEPYFLACRFIMQHANMRARKQYAYSRPDRIRRWQALQEELYEERGEDAERFRYRHEKTECSINTKENRFVKRFYVCKSNLRQCSMNYEKCMERTCRSQPLTR